MLALALVILVSLSLAAAIGFDAARARYAATAADRHDEWLDQLRWELDRR